MASTNNNNNKRTSEELDSASSQEHSPKEYRPCSPFKVEPYLYFNGNAKEVVDFYAKVFNAKITAMYPFGDSMGLPEKYKEQIMHASLELDNNYSIMFSDHVEEHHGPFLAGNNVHLSIYKNDSAELKKLFDALSEGGKVTMALANSFWGSYYGTLIDKFNIHWMFSGPLVPEEKKEAAEKE